MSELKTKPNEASVTDFLQSIPDAQQRADAERLIELMRTVTGEPATMWGTQMVGFGRYRYRYASGHGGEYFLTGFAPRKANLTLYLAPGLERHADLLARLGKHKNGKGCLYIKRLSDVDLKTLQELIDASVTWLRQTWVESPQA